MGVCDGVGVKVADGNAVTAGGTVAVSVGLGGSVGRGVPVGVGVGASATTVEGGVISSGRSRLSCQSPLLVATCTLLSSKANARIVSPINCVPKGVQESPASAVTRTCPDLVPT